MLKLVKLKSTSETVTCSGGFFNSAAQKLKIKTESTKKIPEVFAVIAKTITPEIVANTQAVFQFNLTGKEEGVWYLDLKNGEGSCGKGEPEHAPDATLTMDSDNFVDLFAGKLKAVAAFMLGKLKLKGDMGMALKLEKILKKMNAKP